MGFAGDVLYKVSLNCFSLQSKREDLRAHIVQCYRQTARKEHMNILMRRQIIEERKEKLENLNVQRVSSCWDVV